jgi:hypothetical protein
MRNLGEAALNLSQRAHIIKADNAAISKSSEERRDTNLGLALAIVLAMKWTLVSVNLDASKCKIINIAKIYR